MAIEPIPAPVGTFQRDFQKEQAKLEEMGVNSLQVGMLNPVTLFEATYTPAELAQLPDYLNIKGKKEAAAGAEASLLATPKPTVSGMRILENGLRAKAGIGDQAIGESDIFSQAGLSGYAVLKQSMAQRGAEMDRKYTTFANELEGVTGAFRDTYNLALDRYNVLQAAYKEETDRFNSVIDDLMDHEQSMLYLQEQFKLNKELAGFKAGLKDEVVPGSAFDIKEGPTSTSGDWQNRILGQGTITAGGGMKESPLWSPGLDVFAAGGSSVKSPGKGTIVKMVGDFEDPGAPKIQKDQNDGFGNQVGILLEDGNVIFLSHLNTVNGNLTEGMTVEAGQEVGTVGRTGSTLGNTGYHVDITMGAQSAFGNETDGYNYNLGPAKSNLWTSTQVKDYVAGEVGTFQETAADLLPGFAQDFLPESLSDLTFGQLTDEKLEQIQPLVSSEAVIDKIKEKTGGSNEEDAKAYIKALLEAYFDKLKIKDAPLQAQIDALYGATQ